MDATDAIIDKEPSGPISLDERMRELEVSLITWALKTSHGNKSRAAALLQMKRSTLGDRIRHCGLDRVRVESERHANEGATTL